MSNSPAESNEETPHHGGRSERPPATDSPWFWVYLFATVGLAFLLVMLPKIERRQAQIEGKYHALEGTLPESSHVHDELPMGYERQQTVVTLRALVVVVAVLIVLGWIGFWYQRLRRR